MSTVTYSEARNNLKQICDEVQASHDVTRIVRKNGDMILLSADDWESIEETLQLARLPGAIERITKADGYQPLDDLSPDALAAMTGRAGAA
jgi:antitoxin YefM